MLKPLVAEVSVIERAAASDGETILLEHPAVLEAAVVGLPDSERGEVVAAFIVLRAGHAPGDSLACSIRDAVKTATATYKYPRVVRFVTELPKTPTGKIQRNVLRQRARDEDRAAHASPPQGAAAARAIHDEVRDG